MQSTLLPVCESSVGMELIEMSELSKEIVFRKLWPEITWCTTFRRGFTEKTLKPFDSDTEKNSDLVEKRIVESLESIENQETDFVKLEHFSIIFTSVSI